MVLWTFYGKNGVEGAWGGCQCSQDRTAVFISYHGTEGGEIHEFFVVSNSGLPVCGMEESSSSDLDSAKIEDYRLGGKRSSRLYRDLFRRILLCSVGRWGVYGVGQLKLESQDLVRPLVKLTLCNSLTFDGIPLPTVAQLAASGCGCVKDLTQASLGFLLVNLRSV